MSRQSSQPSRAKRCGRAPAALIAGVAGLLATAPVGGTDGVTWPEASWNPVPLADDLIIPMPCNGAMAFRIIAVGPEPRALAGGQDFSDLAGPLPLGPRAQGAYLLGKYEVTRLQAAALRAYATGGSKPVGVSDAGTEDGLYHPRISCPRASPPLAEMTDQAKREAGRAERLPQAYIPWHDAIALAEDYSAWLMSQHEQDYPDCRPGTAVPCVPRLAGETAVVRLPTEPEWEYAARGGQAVSAAAFRNPLPPLVAGFDRHAWTAANAGADPWPIGSRLAGPLGLHDLFGNVSEIQYATEASERGAVFIARGGGYQSQPGQADSRYRDRFRVYDEQGRGRLSETGLRLLIGAPVQGAPPAVTKSSEQPRLSSALWIAAGAVLLLTLTALGRALWLRRRGLTANTDKGLASTRSSASAADTADQAAFKNGKQRERDLVARLAQAEAQLQAMAAAKAKRQADEAARRIADETKQREQEQAARLAQAEAQLQAMAAAKAKRQTDEAARRIADETKQREQEQAARLAEAEAKPAKAKPQREAFIVFRDRLRDGSDGPEMVALPGGRFQMGSPASEPGRGDDERQHLVQVGPFAIGRTEVTFDEYDAFAKATDRALPADNGWGRGRQPVINVVWDDATAYVEWLSEQTGSRYRLPTEAEWEYAARAGTDTRWSFGDDEADLAEYAWYDKNSGYKAQIVATRKPNPWGLYDMHGNLSEWVSDWYGPYPRGDEVQTDPTGPASGSSRVLRGGAFDFDAQGLRCSYRGGFGPEVRGQFLGFRCARAPRRQP